MAGWVSPTSYADGDGLWGDESKAYDNNTGSYAGHITHPAGTWTGFLYLYTSSIYCTHVRYWRGEWLATKIANIDLDAYYDESWHNVYQGQGSVYSGGYWHQFSLGGTYEVTAIRIRMQNTDSEGRPTFIREAGFYQVDGPILQSEDIDAVSSVTGSLTVMDPDAVVGSTNTFSNVSGSLKVETTLAGVSTVSSSCSGNIIFERIGLVSSISASSNVVGLLDVQLGLFGVITASSNFSGNLEVLTILVGIISAVSFATADRLNSVKLAGSLTGVTSPSGDATASLSVITSLAGVSTPSSSLIGFINLELGLTGSLDASANLSSSLSVLTILAGTSFEIAVVSAVRLNTVILKGSLIGITSPFGNAIGSLSVLTTLVGIVAAGSVSSAVLTVLIIGFYEKLNNDLAAHFQSLADEHGWTVRYDNDQRVTPNAGLWFQFTIDFGQSANKHIGKINSYRHPMLLIIKARKDAGLGMSELLYPVDLIATTYRRKIIGNIITRVPNIKKIGRVDDLYQVDITCPFYIDN